MYHDIDDGEEMQIRTTTTDRFWEVWTNMLNGTTYYAIRFLSDTVTAFCSVEEVTLDALRRAKRLLN